MLKQYIKHIVILIVTLGIIQDSAAVNYKMLRYADLQQEFHSKSREISELSQRIGNTALRQLRASESEKIMSNIAHQTHELQKQEELGNDSKVNSIKIAIAQWQKQLTYIELDDQSSIEDNQRLSILRNELDEIKSELDNRNNNHSVISDNQHNDSIASPLEHHSPVISIQSSNSDLPFVSSDHSLSRLTQNISTVNSVDNLQASNTSESLDSYEAENNTQSNSSYTTEHPNTCRALYTSTPKPKGNDQYGNLLDELASANSANKSNDENKKNFVRKLFCDYNVLNKATSSQQNNHCLSVENKVVCTSHSHVRAKRSLEHGHLIETTDKSTSIEDLLVLENDLSDKIIENWGFEDQEFVEDTNRISTTGSEEVAIDDSYADSPTTLTNALNTEVLLEGVDETKSVSLNNEINNINEKVAVQVHHVKEIIDVASGSYVIPHNIIKNRLLNDGFMPIAVAAWDENKQGTGIWASGGYSISKQGNFSTHLPYKSRLASMTIGGDIELGEGSILGAAYSNAQAHLKFNNLNGKSRIHSHILSVYSQHNLASKLHLQLVGSGASSTIRSKMVGARSKESYVDNISLDSNLIYRHSFSNGMQLLPTMGLKYDYLREGVDKRQKQAEQTIIVNHKHERILSSNFGTKVIFNPIELSSSLRLTPTMHAGVARRMTSGRKMIMASITTGEGAKGDVRVELPRVVRNKYNVGAGLIVQSSNLKLQLDYHYRTQQSYKVYEAVMQLTINL